MSLSYAAPVCTVHPNVVLPPYASAAARLEHVLWVLVALVVYQEVDTALPCTDASASPQRALLQGAHAKLSEQTSGLGDVQQKHQKQCPLSPGLQ